jgi:lipid-A-disaccharide synthase-like uncharacterized protein
MGNNRISMMCKSLNVNAIFWAFIGTLAALIFSWLVGWLPIVIGGHQACPPGIG